MGIGVRKKRRDGRKPKRRRRSDGKHDKRERRRNGRWVDDDDDVDDEVDGRSEDLLSDKPRVIHRDIIQKSRASGSEREKTFLWRSDLPAYHLTYTSPYLLYLPMIYHKVSILPTHPYIYDKLKSGRKSLG